MVKIIYAGLLVVFIGGMLGGCKKETFAPKRNLDSKNLLSTIKSSVSDEEETILGDKLPNPFKLLNMQEAYSILNGGAPATPLQVNQIYVRFLISNPEEAKNLESRNLILSTVPLDYEVIQYGSFYNDPYLNNQIWMYTTVDINFNFNGLTHEILDELFLPELLIGTSQYNVLFSSFDHDELIDQALILKGYEDETGDLDESKAKNTKYRPKGYIRVEQKINSTTTIVPVKNILVRTRFWFNYGSGYTNDNGYFESDSKYNQKRNVNIICIFENNNVKIRAIKGVQFWDIFNTERKNIGEVKGSALENINYLFKNSSVLTSDVKRKWMACHAINSIREHHVYCSQNGILAPPTNLNLWLTNANDNGTSLTSDASAPMLKQMANNSIIIDVAQLYLVASGHPWYAVAMQVLMQFPPDITYNYSDYPSLYLNSDQISQTFYHELSHASHFNKVGVAYWTDYIIYIVSHQGYGTSTNLGSGRIAISEAWAEFCGSRFAHLKYGNNNSLPQPSPGNWNKKLEDFIPYANTSSWNWIPDGIMHDLTDVGELASTNVIDNVSGFSMSQVFGSMDSDITSVLGYRNRFKLEYGNAQKPPIDALFKSYGYN